MKFRMHKRNSDDAANLPRDGEYPKKNSCLAFKIKKILALLICIFMDIVALSFVYFCYLESSANSNNISDIACAVLLVSILWLGFPGLILTTWLSWKKGWPLVIRIFIIISMLLLSVLWFMVFCFAIYFRNGFGN